MVGRKKGRLLRGSFEVVGVHRSKMLGDANQVGRAQQSFEKGRRESQPAISFPTLFCYRSGVVVE